jgi:cytochrome c biogenesis protein CcmG/thiol:disulfide interchange protein DsbE
VRLAKKWAALGLAAVLVAGCDRGSRPGQIGQAAPLFALNDGVESVDMANLRGQVVVLNFWATWCGPCIEELPSLTAMQAELPQVKVVAVSTDEDERAYQEFLVKHPVHLLSVRDSAQKSNALYGSERFPETFIIDKTGVVRRKFIGAQNWTSPEIVSYLKKLAA